MSSVMSPNFLLPITHYFPFSLDPLGQSKHQRLAVVRDGNTEYPKGRYRVKDATLQRAWCLSEETQRQGKKPLVVIEVGIEMPLKGAVGWEEARAHCRLWKCPTSSSGS